MDTSELLGKPNEMLGGNLRWTTIPYRGEQYSQTLTPVENIVTSSADT